MRLLRALVAAALATTLISVAAPAIARADVTTISVDPARTGWDQNESALTPAAVTDARFGQLFSTAVNGQVYAQPLVIGSTVIVATENNWVYGLDAETGAVKWKRSVGPAWPASAIGCGDLTPNIGITSTPVYDPATSAVYLVAKVNNGSNVQHPNFYMHAMNVATGAERSGWPVHIYGIPGNDTAGAFNPFTAGQRPGLLLLGGRVFAGFASHCDHGPYRGYVVGVRTSDRSGYMWTSEVGQPSGEAGIWQGGGGLVSDGSGRIFLSTGNGVTPAPGSGTPPPGQLGDAVVRLGVSSTNKITAKDFFSPQNAPTLSAHDLDFGSGGPTALPASFGTAAHPHVLMQMGKDGRLFLLDRDHLGGRVASGADRVLDANYPNNGIWGHGAVWGGDGGYVYLALKDGPLRAYRFTTASGGKLPDLVNGGDSHESYTFGSGSPIVTSNGTASGSATVWVITADSSNGTNGRLCAYDAKPASSVLTLLRCLPIGTSTKFAVPATDGGRVYVGTRDGHLLAFGLPAAALMPLAVPATQFGSVNLGSSSTMTVTATANRSVTITGISTMAPYTVDTSGVTFPITLAQGQTVSVPVTFTPTATGPAAGNLTYSTDLGTVQGSLNGQGTQAGLAAAPNAADFGAAPAGTGSPSTVTEAGSGDDSSFSIAENDAAAGARSATVPLSGMAPAAAVTRLTVTPGSFDFGPRTLGSTATTVVTMTNTGSAPVAIQSVTAPSAPFGLGGAPITPLMLAPGDSSQVDVAFQPASVGRATGTFQINASDSSTPHIVRLTGTGVISLPPAGTGWTFNGAARMSGSDLVLTPAQVGAVGSAVYAHAVPSNGLSAQFTVQIGGGTGGDGMTFGMLDPAKSGPTSIGATGHGFGFAGLTGVAVGLVTHQHLPSEPSGNYVGVSIGTVSNGSLIFDKSVTLPQSLRTGTHTVLVTVSGGTVTVTVDGTAAIASYPVSLPSGVYPAFTAACGALDDVHTVRAVAIQ